MTPIHINDLKKPKKPSKYKNVKTTFAGLKFDSQREARRYGELLILERMGTIRGLERQVAYELAPSVKYEGATRAKPALKYICDFAYWEGDKHVIEDVKSNFTKDLSSFKIKRHIMKALLGMDITIVL